MFKHICSFPVGAVVGGILGGLAAVIIIAFSLLYFRKKRRARADHAIIDYEPNHMPFIPDGQPSFTPRATIPDPYPLATPLLHSRSADVVPAPQSVDSQTATGQGIVSSTESHGDDAAIAQRPAASPSSQGQQTGFVSSSYSSSRYEDARDAKSGAVQGVGGTHSGMSAPAENHDFTLGGAMYPDAPPSYGES